jgi:hypothetical protein
MEWPDSAHARCSRPHHSSLDLRARTTQCPACLPHKWYGSGSTDGAATPVTPEHREIAHLVAAHAHVPRLRNELHLGQDRAWWMMSKRALRRSTRRVSKPGCWPHVKAEAVDVHLRHHGRDAPWGCPSGIELATRSSRVARLLCSVGGGTPASPPCYLSSLRKGPPWVSAPERPLGVASRGVARVSSGHSALHMLHKWSTVHAMRSTARRSHTPSCLPLRTRTGWKAPSPCRRRKGETYDDVSRVGTCGTEGRHGGRRRAPPADRERGWLVVC